MKISLPLALMGLMVMAGQPVFGQSSSLFVQEGDQLPVQRPRVSDGQEPVAYMSQAIARTSLTAVRMPEPKVVALHDLVTIIVREATEADSSSSLDTSREFDQSAELTDIPRLRLMNEIVSLFSATDLVDDPKLGVKADREFKGEGDYARKDTFTTRITGRVIDVKPNGTIVLEARKYIKSDKETLDMVLTGTARVRDIGVDNTILSTQLYDLHLEKSHKGEIKKAAKKGILTKVFETIFDF